MRRGIRFDNTTNRPAVFVAILVLLSAFRGKLALDQFVYFYSDSWDYIVPSVQPVGSGFVDSFHSPYVGWVWQRSTWHHPLRHAATVQVLIGIVGTVSLMQLIYRLTTQIGHHSAAMKRAATVAGAVALCASPAIAFYERTYLSDSIASIAFGTASSVLVVEISRKHTAAGALSRFAIPLFVVSACLRPALVWPATFATAVTLTSQLVRAFSTGNRKSRWTLLSWLLCCCVVSAILVVPLTNGYLRTFGTRSLTPASGSGAYMRWSYLEGCEGLRVAAMTDLDRETSTALCTDDARLRSFDANLWAYPPGSATLEPSARFLPTQKFLKRAAIGTFSRHLPSVVRNVSTTTGKLFLFPISDLHAYSADPPILPPGLQPKADSFPSKQGGVPGKDLVKVVRSSFRLIGVFTGGLYLCLLVLISQDRHRRTAWTRDHTAAATFLAVNFMVAGSVGLMAKPMARYLLPLAWSFPVGVMIAAAIIEHSTSIRKTGRIGESQTSRGPSRPQGRANR